MHILIADEMDLATRGARIVLESERGWFIDGEYQALADLLTAVEAQPPDIIICGEHLDPEVDSLSLIDQLVDAAPYAKRIIIGASTDGLRTQDMFDCGMHAYLYRSDPLRCCLVPAVRAVLANRYYLSPTANTEYLIAMQSPLREWRMDAEARAVLRLLAQGLHTGQIALELAISQRRVYFIRQKLRHRFGAVTNEHLISRATEEGFLLGTVIQPRMVPAFDYFSPMSVHSMAASAG